MLNKNDLNADNTYTINGLVQLLGCNRNTVVKKLEKNDFPITSVMFNNRSYTAYIITPEQINKLAFEIATNKGVKYKALVNTNVKADSKNDNINAKNVTNSNNTDITNVSNDTMLRNVKTESKEIIELMTKQQVLETENIKLKDNLHDFQIKNLQLTNEKVSLESKVLMIEDKQNYTNAELGRTTQELTTANKQIVIKNRIIAVLSAILIIIMTIAITLLVVQATFVK